MVYLKGLSILGVALALSVSTCAAYAEHLGFKFQVQRLI